MSVLQWKKRKRILDRWNICEDQNQCLKFEYFELQPHSNQLFIVFRCYRSRSCQPEHEIFNKTNFPKDLLFYLVFPGFLGREIPNWRLGLPFLVGLVTGRIHLLIWLCLDVDVGVVLCLFWTTLQELKSGPTETVFVKVLKKKVWTASQRQQLRWN